MHRNREALLESNYAPVIYRAVIDTLLDLFRAVAKTQFDVPVGGLGRFASPAPT